MEGKIMIERQRKSAARNKEEQVNKNKTSKNNWKNYVINRNRDKQTEFQNSMNCWPKLVVIYWPSFQGCVQVSPSD